MELQGEITRGQMVIEKRSFLETSKKHNVDIIKSIETEKMKQLFMSAFEGKRPNELQTNQNASSSAKKICID